MCVNLTKRLITALCDSICAQLRQVQDDIISDIIKDSNLPVIHVLACIIFRISFGYSGHGTNS